MQRNKLARTFSGPGRSRLAQPLAVFQRRHTRHSTKETAQIRGILVVKFVGNILDRQVGTTQIGLDSHNTLPVDILLGGHQDIFERQFIEVIGTDTKAGGIIGHVAVLDIVATHQHHKVIGTTQA